MSPEALPGIGEDYTSKAGFPALLVISIADLQQFFLGDVISHNEDPKLIGRVLRCWADEEGVLPPLPPGVVLHPLDRSLARGEVGIGNVSDGKLSIVPESSFHLLTRDFARGDFVKRSLTSTESAVVLETFSEVRVSQPVTGEIIDKWIDRRLLRSALPMDTGKKVVYNQWIGTVGEVLELALVENKQGECRVVSDLAGTMQLGTFMVHAHECDVPEHATIECSDDRLVRIKPWTVNVIWNALNQQVPREEEWRYPEPKALWSESELHKLTLLDAVPSGPPHLREVGVFRNVEDDKVYGVKPTLHCKGNVELRCVRVEEVRTRMKLCWQDGTETEEPSLNLVPYRHVDDKETWPGEHVIWRGDDGERRAAIVQTFDPDQRVANILYADTLQKSTVSALELELSGGEGEEDYGVSVGTLVLFSNTPTSLPWPQVPSIGDCNNLNAANIRRAFIETADKHQPIWGALPFEECLKMVTELPVEAADRAEQLDKIDWLGEVVKLHPNGHVSVRLPSGRIRLAGIHDLAVLNEIGSDMEDGEFGSETDMDIDREDRASEASWETLSQGGAMGDEDGDLVIEMTSAVDDAERDDGVDVPEDLEMSESAKDAEEVDPLLEDKEQPEAGPSTNGSSSAKSGESSETMLGDEGWMKFEVLEEAPLDHWFITKPIIGGNKAFFSRIQKEHRALASSLPENIIVRTYEDRTDLMRCLIIGPEGTPYTDAPFVFDVYLAPTTFPSEPPLVHFHSHTNGNGRCNPNLYEEGKVCLSILGTWAGDKSESWNPSKSSLLQVFVSISGLVLVRQPYHCEPAYAKLEGTKEGKVNSRLYSEKAYVLSRSFVRTALERPPTGLSNEIKTFYLKKGRLQAVISHAKRLIEKSEVVRKDEEESWNADAMGSLTLGASLTLKKSIVALERILDVHQAKQSSSG
ncbi:ubiquitin-conjugating enzyme E2 O, partial [Tremellales sp. Uapishka_1]